MKLTDEQLERYERDGFLVFPELFSRAEVDAMLGEVARVSRIDSEMIFREGDDGKAKTMFRLHESDGPTASAEFHAAPRLPRVLGPARQVLGDDALYLHHCKVNMKPAVHGSIWMWHQDFGSWHLDGIERPDMTTLMVMLHDATHLNGCLYFIAGSHRQEWIEPYLDTSTAYKLWSVPAGRMKQLLETSPEPVPIVGKAGTVALFDCKLIHASGHNLSARDRWQAYFCFNRCSNRPRDIENPRPDYVRSTNWTPLEMDADDALLRARQAA